jgi:hypothetical protein
VWGIVLPRTTRATPHFILVGEALCSPNKVGRGTGTGIVSLAYYGCDLKLIFLNFSNDF